MLISDLHIIIQLITLNRFYDINLNKYTYKIFIDLCIILMK